MIIDTHIHLYGFPSLEQLETKIQKMEDAIAFRTRYPELYDKTLTDDPIDISDDLITHMDRHGIDIAVVQLPFIVDYHFSRLLPYCGFNLDDHSFRFKIMICSLWAQPPCYTI